MRSRYPLVSAAVDACRARGCAVEVLHAQEGTSERGDPGAFLRAWNEAGDPHSVGLHQLFTQAQRMMRAHAPRRRST